MTDHSNALREAIILHLKADPAVSAIVGTRVHDEVSQNPTWPFIRYGFAPVRPFETSCADGSEHDVTLHAFARGPGKASITTLAASVSAALGDAPLVVAGASRNYGIDWLDTLVMPDADETADFHAVIRFSATLID